MVVPLQMFHRVPPLISAKDFLTKIKTGGNIRVLDCTWHKPVPGARDAMLDYQSEHIPGAQFFDIEANSDLESSYDRMLPPTKQFQESVSSLGINNETHVLLYDNNEKLRLYSAPRVWWMFRVFGHCAVSVLNGGLPQWKKEGMPVTSAIQDIQKDIFHAKFDDTLYKTFNDMTKIVAHKNAQIIDARSLKSFKGLSQEQIYTQRK